MAIEELENEIKSIRKTIKADLLAKIQDPNNWEMDTSWSGDSMIILKEKGKKDRAGFCISVYFDTIIISLDVENILIDELIQPTFFQRLFGKKPEKSVLRKTIEVMVENFKAKDQIEKLQNKRDILKSLIR